MLLAAVARWLHETNTPTLLAIWALFALSLGLMWGYAGILSFGHAAYFGLGAYTYAIASFNIGESTVPLLLAILIPMIFAAVIGAMMFYGRISDVYLGVITLVVTLILNRFMNATAGDAYRIGNARLGGFNGIPAFPILNIPSDPNAQIFGTAYYYVVIACLLGSYLLARLILGSAFGRVLIGIRENELRMELLGYNVQALKTAIFAICGGVGGPCRSLVRELGRNRHAQRFQPGTVGRSHHLGDCRRPRNADRPDDRCRAARLAEDRCSARRPRSTTPWSSGAILILVVLLIPSGFAPAFVAWRRRTVRSCRLTVVTREERAAGASTSRRWNSERDRRRNARSVGRTSAACLRSTT